MACVKFRQAIKAATNLLNEISDDSPAHSTQVYEFLDHIYNAVVCNYETCNNLKTNLLRRINRRFTRVLASTIVIHLPAINAGIEKIGLILGEHLMEFNLHELCRVRSGLEFLLTEFNHLPVYTGYADKPPCTRRKDDYQALHEYLHNDEAISGKYIDQFDYFLRKACHENKLASIDVHPFIPLKHWWWSEATKCKCINTMFPTMSITTDIELIEDKFDQTHDIYEEL